MTENCSWEAIAHLIHNHQRFVIASHIRPDGDALGCTLAMGICLRQLGKEVTLWNEDGCPEKFDWLPQSSLITRPPEVPQSFDAAIILDTAVKERIGKCLPAIAHAGTWLNIDHHISNPRYGDLNYIDPSAPATGEILFELLRRCELPITYEMADCLYIAISTDTGSFQYPSTTARTYEIGAELVRMGVQIGEINQRLYESYPRRRIELLKSLLNELAFSSEDRCASFTLTQKTSEALGVIPDDNEGLIDTIRSIQGVVVAVFFEEIESGKIRVSLRSKSPRHDVCKIAMQFGGGGHSLAAGIRMTLPLAEAKRLVLKAIDESLTSH